MLSLVIAATLIAASDAQTCNYSSICTDHTMCLYPTTNYGANCLAPVCSGINATTKQQILDLHNELRRKVAKGQETRGNPGPQPPAANMRKLEWDEELATIAQRWANQCIFQHDACRRVSRFCVGQNLYMYSTRGATPNCTQDWAAAVQAWYDEVQNFNKSSVCPFQYTSGTGHYSQVVWANTYLIGCGFTAFSSSDGWYRKLYVCNYGPCGNVIGGSTCMYQIGSACSQCPAGTTCDNSLCA